MAYNRILFSLFSVCSILSVLEVHSAQLPKYGQPIAEQKTTSTGKNHPPANIFLIDSTKINWDTDPLSAQIPTSILNVSNDVFLLLSNDENTENAFVIQKSFYNEMLDATENNDKKVCYIQIQNNNQNYFFKINQHALQNVTNFAAISGEYPQKKPQKALNQPQQMPQQDLFVESISPEKFSLPHPHINANSTAEDLQKKDREALEKNRNTKLEQTLEQKKKKVDAEHQEELNQKIMQQKQENDTAIKSLNLWCQEAYLDKIKKFVEDFPKNKLPRTSDVTNDLADLNAKLKKYNIPEISEGKYRTMCFEKHMAKYASWDIEQFNEYNKALEKNGLPPVEYKHFHERVCSLKIRKTEGGDTGPEAERFKDLEITTVILLEKMSKIEKETKKIKEDTDILSIQNSAQNYTLSRGHIAVENIVFEEALLGLISFIPSSEKKKEIEALEKQHKQLDEAIVLKKTIYDLLQDEAQLENRALHNALTRQTHFNENSLDKILDKQRTKDEKIKNLRAKIQTQRNKYAEKQK